MDSNVSRIAAGTIYSVRPATKKQAGREPSNQKAFTLDQEGAGKSQPPDSKAPTEPLHVSKAGEDEAGSRLDLTA